MKRNRLAISYKIPVAYYFILPAIVMELFIHVIPMMLGVSIGFKDITQYNILQWVDAPFIGLKNFLVTLNPANPLGQKFFQSMAVTFKYGIICKIFHFAFGIWGAMLMHRAFKGRTVFRTIFMLPYAIPSFISAISWRFMFLKDWGLINVLLVDKLHILSEKPFWLVGDNSLYAIITAQVWRGWSFHFVMILAALQAIPDHLYEAARIDGAGKIRQFFTVTLPGLKPILSVLLVVNGLRIFNEFETAFVMMGERPPAGANLVSLNVYNQAFVNWNFGLGSATAVSWVVILFVIAMMLMRITKMNKEEQC